MNKNNRILAFIICLVMILCFIPTMNVQAASIADISIISNTNVTAKEAKVWAKSKGATETFIELADLYFKYASKCGQVNPAVAYVQAAKETGYGKFGGVLDETYHNPCGLKTSQGGGDYDKDAHMRFDSWDEGVQAHLDHLALYAGANGYPKSNTYDPRHFITIKGKAKTVNSLGGKWAPSATYGEEINKLYRDLVKSSGEKIGDEEIEDDVDGIIEEIIEGAPNPGKSEEKPGMPEINIPLEKVKHVEDTDSKINIKSDIGWKKENGAWLYYKSDNTLAKGWINPDNNWYYLDSDGKMVTGWSNINSVWYYFKTSGVMAKGWIKDNNNWYYLNKDGAMTTGVQNDGNGLYYMNTSGAMESKTGWQKIDNKWYYFLNDNTLKLGWYKENNIWYYLQGDGSMVTGFYNIDDKVYLFNDSGSMQIGWYKLNNNWYYLNADGSAAKGWIKDNGQNYYLYDTYAMAKGWINLNGTWYHLKDSGAMSTGWISSNGAEYYLEKVTGRMLTNTTVDGFKIGSDGKKKVNSSSNVSNDKDDTDSSTGDSSADDNSTTNNNSSNNSVNGKKTIVVDAGHNYGGDYGAESKINGVKYVETDLNIQIAVKLKSELEKRGYNVIMTREESDKSKDSLTNSLTNRVNIANNAGADFYVSIHHNTAGETAKGVETYYSSNARDSKFTGDIASNKLSFSKKMAASINDSIANKIGALNRGAKDGNLFVCRNTNMPSVLIEVGFITNSEEAIRCADANSQQKVAEAIAEAIAANI